MKKAELFSPLYIVIFSTVIISVLALFNTVILNWKDYSLLRIDISGLETVINLIDYFSDYYYNFNTSDIVNLTINSEFVNLSKGDYSIVFNNSYNLPSFSINNINSLGLAKIRGEWVVS